MRYLLLLASVLVCCNGCNTFRTTAIDRTDNDSLIVNPNCPMKGVPVTLRVPTHLELKVIETTYWEKMEVAGEKATLVPLETCRTTRTVEDVLCYTEKVFLVDPNRPIAGIQNYGFSFRSSEEGNDADAGKGYLSSVEYEVDDQTIQQSANLVSNVLGLVSAFQTSNANSPNENTESLIATDRTVAYARFDINSCTFEQDVEAFIDSNVNGVSTNVVQYPVVCPPVRNLNQNNAQ